MDIRIINAIDILPVTNIDLISVLPFQVELKGAGFMNATSVYINATQLFPKATAGSAYGFTIISDNNILIDVPELLWETVIERVVVLGDTQTLTENTKIEFDLTALRPVSGISKVLQQFVKILMTTTGTNAFRPSEGGDIAHLAGANMDSSGVQGIVSRIQLGIKKCTRDLRNSQRYLNIPGEERILGVYPIDISYDSATASVDVKMEFQTQLTGAVVHVGVS